MCSLIKKTLFISLATLFMVGGTGVMAQTFYTTTDKGNLNLPKDPLVTSNLNGPVLTTDWCANLAFAFKRSPSSATTPLYADPLMFTCDPAKGLNVGQVDKPYIYDNKAFIYTRHEDFWVAPLSLNSSVPRMDGYSDWGTTASWDNGSFKATMAHGSPFVYLETTNGIRISTNSMTTWHTGDNVLGITIDGRNYALFAPTGATWSVNGNTAESNLNGKNYCSAAALPDNQQSTLDYFKTFAYNFITDTRVTWSYDQARSKSIATYQAHFTKKENGGSDAMLYALYPHQWLNCTATFKNFSYSSGKGPMKVLEGVSFTTVQAFTGVLPHLPLVAAEGINGYSETKQKQYVTAEANKNDNELVIRGADSYSTGVTFGRTAQLVRIADQLGMTAERNKFLNVIKSNLENWFTYTPGEGKEYFYYDKRWGTLIGVPAGYGSDDQINDHHFHYGYFIMAAATVAQYDTTWAMNWKSKVDMLIRDYDSWMRDDPMFPFLRGFDVYAGHSWASGHAEFIEGNNQESSSESVNCAAGIALWGMATGDTTIRNLGIYLYSTETEAVHNYWYDWNKIVFPAGYSRPMNGMVWSLKSDYATWFGGLPDHAEYIHGINMLPITAASLHLGLKAGFPSSIHNYLESQGPINEWHDVLWEFLALSEPVRALNLLESNPNYNFTGSPVNDTRAHTYHWMQNLSTLGTVQNITANTPSFAVFDDGSQKTYVVYNEAHVQKDVIFSDGKKISVPARQLVAIRKAVEQTPYAGIPLALPATIEAENYDLGGTLAYADATPTNEGGAYRPGGVDIEASKDGGFDVGWTAANEWMEYTVDVPADGQYTTELRVASKTGGGIAELVFDNGQVSTGSIAIPSTNDWQVWQTITGPTLSLKAGVQVMRLNIKAGGFNINYVKIGKIPMQNIELSKGWNLISFNVLPPYTLVDSVFASIEFTCIKTATSFYHKEQPPQFNSLQNIGTGVGYIVYCKSPGTITIVGTEAPRAALPLVAGWNLVGVPVQASFAVDALPAVTLLVKDFTGFYQPGNALNTITSLKPGKAYFINVSDSSSLKWE